MAHSAKQFYDSDKQPLKTGKVFVVALLVGLIALGLALTLALTHKGAGDDAGLSRFAFAYLTSFLWVLAVVLGALFIVVVTHLYRAGWVVAVRRLFEAVAVNIWVVALLAIPLGIFAAAKPGVLFPWSQTKDKVEIKAQDAANFLAHVDAVFNGEKGPVVPKDSEYASVKVVDNRHNADGQKNAMPYAESSSQYSADKTTAEAQQRAQWWQMTSEKLEYKAWGGVHGKGGFHWYDKVWFVVRLTAYFLIWGLMAGFYWRHSVRQDVTRDHTLTNKREWWAPLCIIVFALTTTLASFDLILSLDPSWFSTMFGLYLFANATLAGACVGALMILLLSKKGLLKTPTIEHLHDIGKLMFAFSFFWGYIAFCQYLLIWYANVPEETYWYEIHGITTLDSAPQFGSGWSWVSVALLVCHLFIPFAFLLSRHVKRNRLCLGLSAVFLLAVVWLDFYWLVMPSYTFLKTGSPTVPVFGAPEILTFIGLASILFAGVARSLGKVSPIAHGDPRLHESVNLDANVWTPFHTNH